MRIAIAGLSVEVLLNSPLTLGPDEMQMYRGRELLDGDLWLVRGVVERLRQSPDVEIVPLMWATALPGGPLTRANYEAIRRETLDLLAAHAPLDGVVLANHGALEVQGYDVHGDTDFITSVRAAIGPDVPLAIAFDLHGNLTPEIAAAGTVFSALRTAPHRDDRETGYRAADQLLDVIARGLQPKTALVQIPIMVPGEKAVTYADAAQSLYASLPERDREPGVMQTILMVGFAWNDVPWAGMTAMVTTEDTAAHASRLVAALANDVWTCRHEFKFPMETASVDDGIARAMGLNTRPVFLSDSGDNTTMGAPGDLTVVLQRLIAAGATSAFVPGITAPETVRQCREAGPGAQIEIVLGSEQKSLPPNLVRVQATVEAAGDELRLGGFQPYRSVEPGWAKVRIGGVVATFHEQPIGITTPAHFTALGVDTRECQIVVVKLGYLHPQLDDVAAHHILLLSPGAGNMDFESMTWRHIRRPAFPLDPDMTWHADG